MWQAQPCNNNIGQLSLGQALFPKLTLQTDKPGLYYQSWQLGLRMSVCKYDCIANFFFGQSSLQTVEVEYKTLARY
jgi:hypothetical protein